MKQISNSVFVAFLNLDHFFQNPTVVRESIFTGAYLGVIPVVREKMTSMWPDVWSHNQVGATVVASLMAGVAATTVTHPFDTIKTRMQANIGVESYR